jgi:hypothetical protein
MYEYLSESSNCYGECRECNNTSCENNPGLPDHYLNIRGFTDVCGYQSNEPDNYPDGIVNSIECTDSDIFGFQNNEPDNYPSGICDNIECTNSKFCGLSIYKCETPDFGSFDVPLMLRVSMPSKQTIPERIIRFLKRA